MTQSTKFEVTKEQIAKASAICEKVRSLIKADNSTQSDDDLTKSPSDGFFSNPSQVLMSEDAISSAPESIAVLAAFLAQSVEGLQDAISILSKKIEVLTAHFAETSEAVLKAQDSTLDLIKAVQETTPVSAFRSPAAFVPKSNLQKASSNPPKSFVIEQLSKYVELQKASPADVALFEGSGRLSQHLNQMIMDDWQRQN